MVVALTKGQPLRMVLVVVISALFNVVLRAKRNKEMFLSSDEITPAYG